MGKVDKTATLVLLCCCLLLAGSSCNGGMSATSVVRPTSQSPIPTVIDRGLLYGEPCAPPCWEGITPRVSTEAAVVRSLIRLKAEGRIEKYSRGPVSYLVIPPGPAGGSITIFLSEDGFVSSISLGYWGTDNLRVKRLIDRYGEPEAVVLYYEFERSAPCSCGDWDDQLYNSAPPSNALLLYPSHGMSVGVIVPNAYLGCICPEMMTLGFSYYQPITIEEALQSGRTPVFLMADLDAEDLSKWHGYGSGYNH